MGVVFDNGYRTVGGTVLIKETTPDILQVAGDLPILQSFNEKMDECKLDPFILRRGSTMNIHWKPVPEAAEYIVRIYKFISEISSLYFMSEYQIDRNRCFLAISNLIDNGFIVQIAAENREGNIIAKSRGILDLGRPKNW